MEIEHVPETAVCEGRTEYGDVVFVGPVADGGFVVYFFAEAVDYGAGGPD